MFEQLKIETKNNHILLEKAFTTKIKNLSSTNEYGQLLATLHDYYEPLEMHIRSLITEDILPDIDTRRKASHLLNDMREINYIYRKNDSAPLPKINSLSLAAGALYVLEGSTHGGPYIAKMIQKQIGVPAASVSYFVAYGDQVAERWSYFRTSLENKSTLFNPEMVIKGANDTFSTLHDWLHINLDK